MIAETAVQPVPVDDGDSNAPRSAEWRHGTMPAVAMSRRYYRHGHGVRYHFAMLLAALGVLLLARLLELRGTSQVVVPFADFVLPGLCSFRRLLGAPCPGCGLTRSFIALAHGELALAWTFNPAGLLLFAVAVFQLPYRIVQLGRLWRGRGEWHSSLLPLCAIAVGGALIAQWVWRLTF